MGKLKSIGPQLRSVRGPLDKAPPATEAERSRRRLQDAPWRAWYGLQRWKLLRLEILRRDQWTCRQTGVLLIGKKPAPNSPIVDHIEPHKGDPALFWDPDNLQALSKAWHDREKQRLERLEGY